MFRDPRDNPPAEALEQVLADRGDRLMAIAVALSGSRVDAEDLLQAALERLLRHRHGVTDREAYLRRTLYNLAADGWRRRGAWRRKIPLLRAEHRSGADAAADREAAVDLRDMLVRLLRQLPPRQRAVIVLRYWEQLTEAEAAAVLGCSEGTVKSAASRGLQRLRELAGAWPDTGARPAPDAGQGPAPGAGAGPARDAGTGTRQRAMIAPAQELIDVAKETS